VYEELEEATSYLELVPSVCERGYYGPDRKSIHMMCVKFGQSTSEENVFIKHC
jgi:hypothetical protein